MCFQDFAYRRQIEFWYRHSFGAVASIRFPILPFVVYHNIVPDIVVAADYASLPSFPFFAQLLQFHLPPLVR